MSEISYVVRPEEIPEANTRIFRLLPPRVNKNSLLETARRFGMRLEAKTGVLQQDHARIIYSEGPHILILFRASGALRYCDKTRWQRDDGRSHVEFGDREAVKIAEAFVKRLNLAPEKEYEVLKVTRLHAGTLERETGKAEERVIDVAVAFRRLVEGVPVDGPGGKIIVYMDHRGEVTGCDRIWRNIRDVYRRVESLRPPGAIESDLERYCRRLGFGRVQVRECRFGYFEQGKRDPQRYLQPAYVFMLTLLSPDERFRRNSVYVATAASNPVGKLTPLPKRAPKQPERG